MSIRVLSSSKVLPQLNRTTIHNAVFARKGAQCVIMRMPLTQSVCSEVDYHELGTMVWLDPMQQYRRKSGAGSRRALTMHVYNTCHVAPSHRRLAHPSWIAGIFFSCNAGLVLDMVGQLLEMVKTDRKSPW